MIHNHIYDESRKFDNVFPTYAIFSANTIPYFMIDYEPILMEKVYKRLKLRYGSSYFAYKNIGTIYEKNVEKVEVIASNLKYYEVLKTQLDKEMTFITTSKNFDTDNLPDADVIGGLTDKNEYTNFDISNYQKLLNNLNSLNLKINKLYQNYAEIMLNNEYYERGDVYEN